MRNAEIIKTNNNVKNIIEWVSSILIAFILTLIINKFILFKVSVVSGSMIPTLNIGEHFFVTRTYNMNNLKRGDIVVFHSNEFNERFIKRLIGLPNDKIVIKNGQVFVNGEQIQQDYIENNDNFNGEFEVPEEKYFFLGDNRANSNDSRLWKNPYIDAKDIEGKARLKIYPFDKIGWVK